MLYYSNYYMAKQFADPMAEQKVRAAEISLMHALDRFGINTRFAVGPAIDLAAQNITSQQAKAMGRGPEGREVAAIARGSILFVVVVEQQNVSRAQDLLDRLPAAERQEALAAFDRIARNQNPTGIRGELAISLRITNIIRHRLEGSEMVGGYIDRLHDDARTSYKFASVGLDGLERGFPLPEPIVIRGRVPRERPHMAEIRPRPAQVQKRGTITGVILTARSSAGRKVTIKVTGEPGHLAALLNYKRAQRNLAKLTAEKGALTPKQKTEKRRYEGTVWAFQRRNLIGRGEFDIRIPGIIRGNAEGREQLASTAKLIASNDTKVIKITRKRL